MDAADAAQGSGTSGRCVSENAANSTARDAADATSPPTRSGHPGSRRDLALPPSAPGHQRPSRSPSTAVLREAARQASQEFLQRVEMRQNVAFGACVIRAECLIDPAVH